LFVTCFHPTLQYIPERSTACRTIPTVIAVKIPVIPLPAYDDNIYASGTWTRIMEMSVVLMAKPPTVSAPHLPIKYRSTTSRTLKRRLLAKMGGKRVKRPAGS
jgi:hypothetical protein